MTQYRRGRRIVGSPEEAIAAGIGAAAIGEAVAEKVDNLSRQMKIPTHPFYDSTNFPDNAVYGQIVVDKDDPSVLWVYGKDDQWHKVGGADLKWAIASAESTTIANATSFIDTPLCPPRSVDPGDGRGPSFYLSNADGSIYDSLGGSLKGINILVPGAYLFMASVTKQAGAAFTTMLSDRAATSGVTSLHLSNWRDGEGATAGGLGSKASLVAFYVFTASDIAGAGGKVNMGFDIYQASGADQFYNFATLLLLKISGAISGFLP